MDVAETDDGALGTGSQAVTQQLMDMFVGGNFRPGDRLPAERRLAENFGVGRAAIREALAALEMLGVVETRHGAGTYLQATAENLLPRSIEWGLLLNQREAIDLAEAREQLEISIVQLAATRASAQDIDRLSAAQGRMESATSDPDAFVAADVEFHLELAKIAGNSVLAGMLASTRSLLEVWIRRASSGERSTNLTLEEHRRIVDAVTTGNVDSAKGAMRVHMNGARARLVTSLDDSPPQSG
ncbi:FadR/GntR family transcriptional regulator [Kribbella kalugense]|uniref:GntR family transcriptional regulator n=1 Tax=Kribbella kalugense TaxID=2512221 RepID=A0A4R8A1B2_9ACTN|nr:FadR/GntR family transcriptional regulator [Kribbella kalugense]TDW24299.1 GntR family transcriptional regulator [Kribbella kalugense]